MICRLGLEYPGILLVRTETKPVITRLMSFMHNTSLPPEFSSVSKLSYLELGVKKVKPVIGVFLLISYSQWTNDLYNTM